MRVCCRLPTDYAPHGQTYIMIGLRSADWQTVLLIRGLHNLRAAHRGCVATIGNFDGVHLGHQAVLSALTERARAAGLPSLSSPSNRSRWSFSVPSRRLRG